MITIIMMRQPLLGSRVLGFRLRYMKQTTHRLLCCGSLPPRRQLSPESTIR